MFYNLKYKNLKNAYGYVDGVVTVTNLIGKVKVFYCIYKHFEGQGKWWRDFHSPKFKIGNPEFVLKHYKSGRDS